MVTMICGPPSGAEALTLKAFYDTAGSRAPSNLFSKRAPAKSFREVALKKKSHNFDIRKEEGVQVILREGVFEGVSLLMPKALENKWAFRSG